jgi:hypothetical protein
MNQMTSTGNLTHGATNDTRLHDLELRVNQYGRDKQAGIDSMPKFALDFIRGVQEEYIDIKHDANKEDGAVRFFNRYAEAGKAVHDRSGDSVKAQQSKFRALQKAAANPKWDFIQVADHAVRAIAQFRKDQIDTKGTFAALVDVAREQMKTDVELTYDEVAVICLPTSVVKEVTVESKLAKISKQMEELITGEGKDGLKDQSPELMQAQELVAGRIKDLIAFSIKQADDATLAAIAARRGGVYVAS